MARPPPPAPPSDILEDCRGYAAPFGPGSGLRWLEDFADPPRESP